MVTINFRGVEDTVACIRSLEDLDWPNDRLEIVCVDNASADGSVERLKTEFPEIDLVESPTNGGFAGGCNIGVARSTGEYIAFLNNDARPDPAWLSAAVEVLELDPSIGCVASKVVNWEGDRIDYVDGSMTWYGMGYKREAEAIDEGRWNQPKDVLYATGAAMVVRSDLYRAVGGFDDRFFMFFEDVDFGWRLNLLGHRVRYVPTSIAYHRHHASMKKLGSWRERYLLERNALMCLYKNAEDETLSRLLAPAIALTIRRAVALGGDDPRVLDLERTPPSDESEQIAVSRTTLTGAFAVDYFVEQLPHLDNVRRTLRSGRKRSDAEISPLFRIPMEPIEPNRRYKAGYDALVTAFDVADVFTATRAPVPSAPPSGSSTDPQDLLQQYRAAAAARAVLITRLRISLDATAARAAKMQARLDKQEASIAQLRGRLGRAEAKLDKAKLAKAERNRANQGSSRPATLAKARRGLRRLAGDAARGAGWRRAFRSKAGGR